MQLVQKRFFCLSKKEIFLKAYFFPEGNSIHPLPPRAIVKHLDDFVISQTQAKKAIAVALRNRWRRKQLDQDFKRQIIPRNILMFGPTGCGKTELARRMASLSDSPFLKVQATKYTQVGYMGKDVTSIIEDLTRVGIAQLKKLVNKRIKDSQQIIIEMVDNQIVKSLLGEADSQSYQECLQKVKAGQLDSKNLTMWPGTPELPENFPLPPPYFPISTISGTIQTLRARMKDFYTSKVMNLSEQLDLVTESVRQVEQDGIVFIDQIDKIATPQNMISTNRNISTDGVQRDLLPIIQGTTVKTKLGQINTDHILFIAGGAFNKTKPNDLIPELLGRFPIKVGLSSLSQQQLVRVLKEPKFNLLKQHNKLLASEGLQLKFTEEGICEIARQACIFNSNQQNLGVRRLHGLLQKVLEEVSFEGGEYKERQVVVDDKFVRTRLEGQLQKFNVSRHVL